MIEVLIMIIVFNIMMLIMEIIYYDGDILIKAYNHGLISYEEFLDEIQRRRENGNRICGSIKNIF